MAEIGEIKGIAQDIRRSLTPKDVQNAAFASTVTVPKGVMVECIGKRPEKGYDLFKVLPAPTGAAETVVSFCETFADWEFPMSSETQDAHLV